MRSNTYLLLLKIKNVFKSMAVNNHEITYKGLNSVSDSIILSYYRHLYIYLNITSPIYMIRIPSTYLLHLMFITTTFRLKLLLNFLAKAGP